MNWYSGSIAEAVNLSKTRNSIFVVYVEDDNEQSQKMRSFVNHEKIRAKLESEHFVAIRIVSGSEAYSQFSQIYKLVPLPSLFFIGKNGTPIEVLTSLTLRNWKSVEELESKINNILVKSGYQVSQLEKPLSQDSDPQPTTSSAAEASALLISKEKNSENTNSNVVCENGVCSRVPEDIPAETANVVTPDPAKQLEEAKMLLQKKRDEKEAEEERLEREREIQRRKDGRELLNLQKWQHEQELKELKENIRRDRLEEQAARQKILEKIANDRAERAQKFAQFTTDGNNTPSTSAGASAPTNTNSAGAIPKPSSQNQSEFACIQFKKPDGESYTHKFNSSDKFQIVRDYVRSNLLDGTGIRDFSLATTFPRKEFTATDDAQTLINLNLCPNSVVLVIAAPKSAINPSSIVAHSGGFVNVFNTVFWGLLSPFIYVFGYIRNFIAGNNSSNPAKQKRASDDETNYNDAAKRRNLGNQFDQSKASTSSSNSGNPKDNLPYRRVGGSNIHRLRENKDSDDENNTWNGNSTQQQ